MRILIVTSAPLTAEQLRQAVGQQDAEGAEVMVVAPALHESGLRFWMSDADEAIGRAREVAEESVRNLEREGIGPTSGDTGEGDIGDAVADALATFAAQRILLFTRSGDSEDKRYGEDVSLAELRERFAVPVEQHTL